jgi:hypothetical protein
MPNACLTPGMLQRGMRCVQVARVLAALPDREAELGIVLDVAHHKHDLQMWMMFFDVAKDNFQCCIYCSSMLETDQRCACNMPQCCSGNRIWWDRIQLSRYFHHIFNVAKDIFRCFRHYFSMLRWTDNAPSICSHNINICCDRSWAAKRMMSALGWLEFGCWPGWRWCCTQH